MKKNKESKDSRLVQLCVETPMGNRIEFSGSVSRAKASKVCDLVNEIIKLASKPSANEEKTCKGCGKSLTNFCSAGLCAKCYGDALANGDDELP